MTSRFLTLLLMAVCASANAFEHDIGRVRVMSTQEGWRAMGEKTSNSVPLDQGVSGSMASESRMIAFRAPGDSQDSVVFVLRANMGTAQTTSWTGDCQSSPNITARRLSDSIHVPDCIKKSGRLITAKFLLKGLPTVQQMVESGESQLPEKAHYINIFVGLETGSFVSAAGVVSSSLPDWDAWVEQFAEALRRGNNSLRGHVSLPAVPISATRSSN